MVFPKSYETHKTHGPLEAVLAFLFAARALIWLQTRHWTVQAQRILRLFPPVIRVAFEFGGLPLAPNRVEALRFVIGLQKVLIQGCPELFGLYQWWSDTYRYTGIGQVSRPSCPRQGGLSKRFLEHLFASLRPSSSEGGKFRYRLARRTSLSSCFFLVIAAGPELQIRAMEAFDIRAHGPSSNCAPKSFYGLSAAKSKRLRPPRMLRDSNSRPDITRSIAIHDNYCARFQQTGILHGGQEIPEFVP